MYYILCLFRNVRYQVQKRIKIQVKIKPAKFFTIVISFI